MTETETEFEPAAEKMKQQRKAVGELGPDVCGEVTIDDIALFHFTGYPVNYEKHVQDHREPVRNNFAHGNWEQLVEEVEFVDLDEALWGTAEFVGSMQWKPEEHGYDLTFPTIIPAKLPEGF